MWRHHLQYGQLPVVCHSSRPAARPPALAKPAVDTGLTAQQHRWQAACGLSQMKTSRTFIRDATAASPLALVLFGAGTLDVAHEGGYVALGGWLRFRAPAQV